MARICCPVGFSEKIIERSQMKGPNEKGLKIDTEKKPKTFHFSNF